MFSYKRLRFNTLRSVISSFIGCLLLCLSLTGSKGQERATQTIQKSHDWTQLGGNPERTFYASTAIFPPLKLNKQWRIESNGNWLPPLAQSNKIYIVEQSHEKDEIGVSKRNRVGVLDFSSGKITWIALNKPLGINVNPLPQPAMVAEDIICLPSSELSGRPGAWKEKHLWLAVRAQDGAVRWEFANRSKPLVSPVGVDGLLYTGIGESGLTVAALDATKGQQRWEAALSQVGDINNPVANTVVTAASRSHHFLVAVATHWLITIDTKERKVIDAQYYWGDGISQPSVADGRIYFLGILRYDSKGRDSKMRSSIGLHCLGPKVKKERFWSVVGGVTVNGKLRRFIHPLSVQHLVVGPHEVIVPIEGGVACLEKETGKLRWVKTLSGHYMFQEMVMCQNVLYVADGQEPNPEKKQPLDFAAFDVRTGKQLQRLQLDLKPPVYLMAAHGQIILSERGGDRGLVRTLVLGESSEDH